MMKTAVRYGLGTFYLSLLSLDTMSTIIKKFLTKGKIILTI